MKNQSAFPMNCPDHADVADYVHGGMAGLTKLEYAAIKIAAGVVACSESVNMDHADIARFSVNCADALFYELDRRADVDKQAGLK